MKNSSLFFFSFNMAVIYSDVLKQRENFNILNSKYWNISKYDHHFLLLLFQKKEIHTTKKVSSSLNYFFCWFFFQKEESSLPFKKKTKQNKRIWDTQGRKDPYICVSIPFLYIWGEGQQVCKGWNIVAFTGQYDLFVEPSHLSRLFRLSELSTSL